MRFQGRIALVTAGGRGIGRATAEIIGREGGTVVLVDTDKAALDETTGAIRARGGAAHALAADALDAAQVESVVRRTVQEHKRIDILVNAVGGSTIIGKPAAPIDELTLPDWQQLLHFNLTGTFLFCHAVVPVMKRQAAGKIVNISSIEQKAEVERVPLRRIAEPVDQARVICFLASSDADFVTGVTIDVTGGQ